MNYIPENIALKQLSWERHESVYRARISGCSYGAIGDMIGVTAGRARQMMVKMERWKREEKIAPIVEWREKNEI